MWDLHIVSNKMSTKRAPTCIPEFRRPRQTKRLTIRWRQGTWRSKRWKRQHFRFGGPWWWMPKHWRREGRRRGRTSSWIQLFFVLCGKWNRNCAVVEILGLFLSFVGTRKSSWNFGFLPRIACDVLYFSDLAVTISHKKRISWREKNKMPSNWSFTPRRCAKPELFFPSAFFVPRLPKQEKNRVFGK